MKRKQVGHRTTTAVTLCMATALVNCTETECATPDYSRAECRVLAENEFARLRTSSGVEVRFQTAAATDASASWSAEGIVRERGQLITARVAHMGDFAISLRDTSGQAQSLELELTNLHPAVVIADDAHVVELSRSGAKRRLAVTVPAGGTTWVRASLTAACTPTIRLLAMADVQTNPTQFIRIIERLQTEQLLAAQAGELLLGAVFAGDLTESSSEDEFRVFAEMLETTSVPFALTPGNHDVFASDQPFYNQNFGPGNYAFDVCNLRVAMLDSGSGSVADSVIGRLPELFARGDAEHLLAVMHHPPYAEITAGGWSREDLAAIVLGEFVEQGGELVVAGHAHMLREFRDVPIAGGRVREIITGTAGAVQGAGQPLFGYVRLTITGDADISACFVEVPPPGAPAHRNTTTTIPQCDQG